MKFHVIEKFHWNKMSFGRNSGKKINILLKTIRFYPISRWWMAFVLRKLRTVTVPLTNLHEYSVPQIAKPPANNCTYLLSLFWSTPKALKQKYIGRMKISLSLNASAQCNWADTYIQCLSWVQILGIYNLY